MKVKVIQTDFKMKNSVMPIIIPSLKEFGLQMSEYARWPSSQLARGAKTICYIIPCMILTWINKCFNPSIMFQPFARHELRVVVGLGRNSSVGSAWARCPQRRGFDPPLGAFSGRGDFSLGVNMGSNSIPTKTLSDESINRGLVCAHMHFIARTQKILTFMS